MSNSDTAVLVGWPFWSHYGFTLQGPTPLPGPDQTSGDSATPPVSMQPLPPGAGNRGPIFPTTGTR